MPGLRVLASGFPAGSRIAGSIVLGRPPSRWVSYFLAEDDRVEVAGNRVSFDLGGETLEKGFLLEGDLAGVKSVEARADGRPLPASQILAGQILAGGAGATAVSGGRGPVLRLWLPDARRAPSRDATVNPETEQSLRALGYVQ
jgi:hypothetical protein